MINFIEGILVEKNTGEAVVNVGGVGYEVAINTATFERLGAAGNKVKLYTSESTSMYGGATVLYGFLSKEEKETFLYFKEYVPNTGAKKAMEYVDKAGKSFADFRQAVQSQDIEMLVSIFGFTKKTADKLTNSLKERIGELAYSGKQKWSKAAGDDFYSLAKASLAALGYRSDEAERVISGFDSEELSGLSIEEFLKKALKRVKV